MMLLLKPISFVAFVVLRRTPILPACMLMVLTRQLLLVTQTLVIHLTPSSLSTQLAQHLSRVPGFVVTSRFTSVRSSVFRLVMRSTWLFTIVSRIRLPWTNVLQHQLTSPIMAFFFSSRVHQMLLVVLRRLLFPQRLRIFQFAAIVLRCSGIIFQRLQLIFQVLNTFICHLHFVFILKK